MRWLGETGAGLVYCAMLIGVFAGPLGLSIKIVEKCFPRRRGWWAFLIGVTIFGVLFYVALQAFWPSMRILESYSCRHSGDYADCMGED